MIILKTTSPPFFCKSKCCNKPGNRDKMKMSIPPQVSFLIFYLSIIVYMEPFVTMRGGQDYRHYVGINLRNIRVVLIMISMIWWQLNRADISRLFCPNDLIYCVNVTNGKVIAEDEISSKCWFSCQLLNGLLFGWSCNLKHWCLLIYQCSSTCHQ